MPEQPNSNAAWSSERVVARLDEIRAELGDLADAAERATHQGFDIEIATAMRDAKDCLANAQDMIEAHDV